jgi:DNA primase small subunit
MQDYNLSNLKNVQKRNILQINKLFRDFYKGFFVSDIPKIQTREFGIGEYGKKISNRHLAFNSDDDLNYYLRTKTPFYMSYSTSYFKYPAKRPMSNKEWLGSDIVYEFDSDDFDLSCQSKHNIWYCPNCNLSGIGKKKVCDNCNTPTRKIEWTCPNCIGYVKKETIRLIDFLEKEFKLDPSSFIISFSGSKGFHIRVCDESIRYLQKSARLQLVNYIMAHQLNLKKLGFKTENKQWVCPDPRYAEGWSKNILDYIITFFRDSQPNDFVNNFNIGNTLAKKLYSNKEVILNSLYNKFLWSNFRGSNNFWEEVLEKAIKQKSFKIDPSTSIDIYKITRTPNTIHGGTGFLSKKLNINNLKDFDSFYDPVVLDTKNTRKIRIILPVPKFKLLDVEYGPYKKGEIIEVNSAVSTFLILKGVAL